MSLLNRINRKGLPPKPESLLRQLIFNMEQENSLKSQINQLLKDNDLRPLERQELQSNTVDFLLRDLELVEKKQDPLPLLIQEIGSQLDSPTSGFTPETFRAQAKPLFDSLMREWNLKLSSEEKVALWQGVVSEFVGFGALDALIADGSIREIVVMGQQVVYVRRHDKMERHTQELFKDDNHYKRILDRMFPYNRDEIKLPIRSTMLSRNAVAFCLYQDIEYMSPILIIHKYS